MKRRCCLGASNCGGGQQKMDLSNSRASRSEDQEAATSTIWNRSLNTTRSSWDRDKVNYLEHRRGVIASNPMALEVRTQPTFVRGTLRTTAPPVTSQLTPPSPRCDLFLVAPTSQTGSGPRDHGGADQTRPSGRLHRPGHHRGHPRFGQAGGRHAQPLQAAGAPDDGELRVHGRGARFGHQRRGKRLG